MNIAQYCVLVMQYMMSGEIISCARQNQVQTKKYRLYNSLTFFIIDLLIYYKNAIDFCL